MQQRGRDSITLNKQILLSSVYDHIVLTIVKDIFSKTTTDESPNYIIPTWKASQLLESYNNNFDKLPKEVQVQLLEKLESAIGEYKRKL